MLYSEYSKLLHVCALYYIYLSIISETALFSNKRYIVFILWYIRGTSPVARWGYLAKIPPKQVIADFGRGSSVESE